MGRPLRLFAVMLLIVLLAACSPGAGTDDAILLEPQALTGATTTSATAPGTTTTTLKTTTTEPVATVLGTVVTQPTTTTTTTTTLPPLPEIDGPEASDFTLQLGDGSTFSLADQRRPVLMVFWAEWCQKCLKELVYIDQIAVDYADRVTVLAVARESPPDVVVELVAELMPSGLVLWGLDENLEISGRYTIPGVPVTVLILGATEVKRWLGSAGTEVALREALDECLALLEG